jgi:hypothetical protein
LNDHSKSLIYFAWVIEIVGIAAGMINSAYTTFGDDLPASLLGYIPAVPMVALAAAEAGRVPLASIIYHRHKCTQMLAVLGIAALGYLAIENWTFGFERIVDLRLKNLNVASRDLSRAEAALTTLQEQRTRMASNSSQKREELRRGINQRDTAINDIAQQSRNEAEVHQRNLERIREACRIIREKCLVPRSNAEDGRYIAEQGRLNDEGALQRRERKLLQGQIDALVPADAQVVAGLDESIHSTLDQVAEARQALCSAKNANQIHRLAASWFGVNTCDVTAEQFAKARWVFATFSAVAVSLAGTIAALVYYARGRVQDAPTLAGSLIAKVARARRAYYARKRKPIVREIEGPARVVFRDGKEPPTIVEKEVVRWVDQIVLIPRSGITMPVHINSLIRRAFGADLKRTDTADANSNVMSLQKA